MVFASFSAARAFSALSSCIRLDATPARAALSAICPSLVVGAYAPPANLNPHLSQSQIPTDRRFTAEMWHWGHSCGALISVMIVEYLFLATVPYRAPKLPEGPTLYVLPILVYARQNLLSQVFGFADRDRHGLFDFFRCENAQSALLHGTDSVVLVCCNCQPTTHYRLFF